MSSPDVRIRWDRGTLLFDRDAPVRGLPGVLWDPRVGLLRAPGMAHDALLHALAEAGHGVHDEVPPVCPPAPPLPVPELRPYQEDALAAWDLAGRRGVVVLPTGAGKTRVAIAAIARTGARALCLVPTRVLMEQWVAALKAAGADPGRYGDGERVDAPITVATCASALRHAEVLGNRFGLLLIDEVHHFGRGAGDETLEMSTAALRLGLTATPPESAGRLDLLVGPVVFHQTIPDLAGQWLAPFEIITVSLPLSPDEARACEAEAAVWQPAVRRFFDRAPGAAWTDFVGAAGRTDEGQRALAAWRRSRMMVGFTAAKRDYVGRLLRRHRRSRVLIFTPDNAAACAVSREHLVAAITCDIGRAERARVLGAFARGELRVIVSSRVLNEGVDVPEADVAILIGGTHGSREYVQRIGRVLRPTEGKQAIVYELVTRGTHEVRGAERRRRDLAAS